MNEGAEAAAHGTRIVFWIFVLEVYHIVNPKGVAWDASKLIRHLPGTGFDPHEGVPNDGSLRPLMSLGYSDAINGGSLKNRSRATGKEFFLSFFLAYNLSGVAYNISSQAP